VVEAFVINEGSVDEKWMHRPRFYRIPFCMNKYEGFCLHLHYNQRHSKHTCE
jgi:hypothetical protein